MARQSTQAILHQRQTLDTRGESCDGKIFWSKRALAYSNLALEYRFMAGWYLAQGAIQPADASPS